MKVLFVVGIGLVVVAILLVLYVLKELSEMLDAEYERQQAGQEDEP